MQTLIKGNIITMDEDMPEAKYMLVEDGKIKEVSETEIDAPDAKVVEAEGYVFPGFIEPHGHPMDAAIELSRAVLDIRPVTIDTADGVLEAIKERLEKTPKGEPLFINGWDPLTQKGLPIPDMDYMDKMAPNNPIAILSNSVHEVYFNSGWAEFANITPDTPNPDGGEFIKKNGKLTGVGHEIPCVLIVLGPIIKELSADIVEYMDDYVKMMNSKGITTCANMTGSAMTDGLYMEAKKAGVMNLRIRGFQMATQKDTNSKVPEDKDGMYRQAGIKLMCDGSPWIGDILTSFPYLTNEATKEIGLEPNHICTKPAFDKEQLLALADGPAKEGRQFACHSHGDKAADLVMDVYEELIEKYDLKDHRFRIDHCCAMTEKQFERAQKMGCPVTVFVDHMYYWGEVLVDDLFGEEYGGSWANAGAAEAANCSVTYHNDGTVTPAEPLRNMQVAEDRTSKNGLVLKTGKPASREQSLKAQTIESAYQIKEEDMLGSLSEGKYADFIFLDEDPREVETNKLADIEVLETYLAGEQVYKAK